MNDIVPYRIDVPQADLDDLADRLGRTRWPDELPGAGWDYGFPLGRLRVNATNEWGGLFYGFHPGGAAVGLADGAARLIRESTSLRVIGSLATRSGGEVVAEF